MSQYHGVRSNHIMWWHVVEHSLSTLCAPTFCIHVNQAGTHKVVWMVEAFNQHLVATILKVGKCTTSGILQSFWVVATASIVVKRCQLMHLPTQLLLVAQTLYSYISHIMHLPCYLWNSMEISITWGWSRLQMYAQYWIQSRCNFAVTGFSGNRQTFQH